MIEASAQLDQNYEITCRFFKEQSVSIDVLRKTSTFTS